MFNLTFYVRRLHSLCGLGCLGFFLLEHLFTNARALLGPLSFNRAVGLLTSIPWQIMLPIELCFVAAPFAFHAFYGIYIGLQARNNPVNYPYLNNIQFTLQRLTAWYMLVFLAWHVFHLRVMIRGGGTQITYQLMQNLFENPVIFILYLLGMLAAIFHFCNGISTFCMTWGIAKGPRIQKMINLGCMGLCGLLSLVTVVFMVSYII